MRVFAVVEGRLFELCQVSQAEFKAIWDSHPMVRGVPVLWSDCGLGYQTWPVPEEGIKLIERQTM